MQRSAGTASGNRLLLAAAGLLVAAMPLTASRAAEAMGLGFSAGYGFSEGEPNAYGLGFQGRLGLSVSDIYGGVTYVYHSGTTARTSLTEETANNWYLGGEVGYDLHLADVTVRPYLGAGGLVRTAQACGRDGCAPSASDTSAYIGPGVLTVYDFGPAFVGAEFRWVIVTSADIANGAEVFGTVGVNL